MMRTQSSAKTFGQRQELHMEQSCLALEELKLIQDIISFQEQIRIKIIGWSIATVSAISVAYLSQKLELSANTYLGLSMLIVSIFLWLDTVHRVAEDRAILRSNDIEKSLRGECTYDGPKIGLSVSVTNGIPYQIKSLKNVRVYGPHLALSSAVFIIYTFTC